jgi:hypothetical protein
VRLSDIPCQILVHAQRLMPAAHVSNSLTFEPSPASSKASNFTATASPTSPFDTERLCHGFAVALPVDVSPFERYPLASHKSFHQSFLPRFHPSGRLSLVSIDCAFLKRDGSATCAACAKLTGQRATWRAL